MSIVASIDYAILHPHALLPDVEDVCREAVRSKLSAVCVPPLFIRQVKEILVGEDIKVCTVIGFPFGYSAIEAKVAETVLAIIDGADDIELMVNTLALKNNDWQYLAKEITTIMQLVQKKQKQLTVILETSLLNETELITACDIYGAAGANFIKADSGFFQNEFVFDKLKLIRSHLASAIQIKAGCDVKNYQFALDLMEAGADRLSTFSAVQLMEEEIRLN